MLIQVPITVIINKIGKRNSIILGNISQVVSLLILIFSNNLLFLYVREFFSATAFALKTVAESGILRDSVPKSKIRGDIYSRIFGRGVSWYSKAAAVSIVISGFLYVINPYIPIVLCLAVAVLATLISICFNNTEQLEENKVEVDKTFKGSIKDLKEGFKIILKSSRLKSLFLMNGIIWGLICLLATYYATLLKDLNITAYYIGIIIAMLELMVGVGAKKANWFNTKFKNKSLTLIGLLISFSTAVVGASVIFKIPFVFLMVNILVFYFLTYILKGIFTILKARYLSNFTNSKNVTKIFAVNGIAVSIGRAGASYLGGQLLLYMPIEHAMLCIGIIFSIVVLIMYRLVKNKVGMLGTNPA
jgi:hypothetical protein